MATNSIDFLNSHLIDGAISNHQNHEIAVNPYNRIDVISSNNDFFALREPWNEINDSSTKGTVFNSWEWMYTWWESYQNEGKRSLYILSCTNIHNELLGIAPFQFVNNVKRYFPCNRQLLMLATGETDGSAVFGEYSDLVIKKGHETAVISALSDFLFQHSSLWDGIKLKQQLFGSHLSKLFEMPEYLHNKHSNKHFSKQQRTQSYFGKRTIEKTIVEDGFRTFIDLPKTYEEYLMSLRKKMRNNITRNYSRLESEQDFSITSVTTESEVKAQIAGQESAIETLARLNRIRRGNLDKNSVFEKPRFEQFHRRLLKRLVPSNKISLRILRFNDQAMAALYSFIDNDTVHVYQSGFETENGHRYSLLTTMLTQEISHSIDNHEVTRFNFMYSDDEDTYKRRYSGTTEKMYNISYDKQGLKYSVYCLIHGRLKEFVKEKLNIK